MEKKTHPELVTLQVRVQIVDNIMMLVLTHDNYFINNQLFFRLWRQIHFLDRHFATRTRLNRRINQATCSLWEDLAWENGQRHGKMAKNVRKLEIPGQFWWSQCTDTRDHQRLQYFGECLALVCRSFLALISFFGWHHGHRASGAPLS